MLQLELLRFASNDSEQEYRDNRDVEGQAEHVPLLPGVTATSHSQDYVYGSIDNLPNLPDELSLSTCLHALTSVLFYMTSVVGIMFLVVLATLLWTFLLVKDDCPNYHRFILGSLAYLILLVHLALNSHRHQIIRSSFVLPAFSVVYFYQGYSLLQPCYGSYNTRDDTDVKYSQTYCIDECKDLYVALEIYLITLAEFLGMLWMVQYFAMPIMQRLAARNSDETFRGPRTSMAHQLIQVENIKDMATGDNVECSICMVEFSSAPVVMTPCRHLFHRSCLESWTRMPGLTRQRCPLCRQDMLPPSSR
jgi:hypothetical protein